LHAGARSPFVAMPVLTLTEEKHDLNSAVFVEDDTSTLRPPRAPPNPSSVKINVEGAFIVDEEMSPRSSVTSEHVHWEHKDIRLPHHTDVVSHVAVDVCHVPYRVSCH
jgi:hypothetical protein